MDIAAARLRKGDVLIDRLGEPAIYIRHGSGARTSFKGIFRFGVVTLSDNGMAEASDEVHVYAQGFPYVPNYGDRVEYGGTTPGRVGAKYKVETWYYAENATRYRIVLVADN